MEKNLTKLLIILVNLVLVNSLYHSKILECNYYFESDNMKSRMILKINGYKYRESVTYPNIDSYFSVPVRIDNLNISYHIDGPIRSKPQIDCKYTNGIILENSMSSNNILINNDMKDIFDGEYYYNKKHFLNIHMILSAKPFTFKEPELDIELYYNGEEKTVNTLSPEYPGLSYKLQLKGNEGNNYLDIYARTNGTWCSCPTIRDGYNNNRYVLTWISDIYQDNDLINHNIKDNLWISNSINDYQAKTIGLDMLNNYGEIVAV